MGLQRGLAHAARDPLGADRRHDVGEVGIAERIRPFDRIRDEGHGTIMHQALEAPRFQVGRPGRKESRRQRHRVPEAGIAQQRREVEHAAEIRADRRQHGGIGTGLRDEEGQQVAEPAPVDMVQVRVAAVEQDADTALLNMSYEGRVGVGVGVQRQRRGERQRRRAQRGVSYGGGTLRCWSQPVKLFDKSMARRSRSRPAGASTRCRDRPLRARPAAGRRCARSRDAGTLRRLGGMMIGSPDERLLRRTALAAAVKALLPGPAQAIPGRTKPARRMKRIVRYGRQHRNFRQLGW